MIDKIMDRIPFYIIISLIFYLTVLNSFLFKEEIYGWFSDTYGHLYKIWKLINYGYVEWIKDWYLGSPLFRFYPPLSYLIAAFFGKIFTSDIIGFKITVLLAMIIGAYGTKLLLKEIGINKNISLFLSLLYPIHPYIKHVTIGGAYPRFFGIMLIPWVIYSFIKLSKQNKIEDIIFHSLVFSSLILTHLSVTFTTFLLALGFIPYFIFDRKISFKNIFKNILISIFFVLLITSFWIIPFFVELKYSGIINENDYPDIFTFHSSKIDYLIDIENPRYIGIYFFSFSIIGFITKILTRRNKKTLIYNITLFFMLIFNFILALGYYGPFPFLNKLPFLSKATPDRFLDNVVLLSLIGTAFLVEEITRIEYKKLRFIFLALTMLLVAREISITFYYLNNLWYPLWAISEYNKLLEYFANNSNIYKGVLFQAGPELLLESYITYAPIVYYNISILNGWYRQAHYRLMDHITGVSTILHNHNLSIRKDLKEYVVEHLIFQNVQCISVHKYNKNYNLVQENLKLIDFKKDYENEHFELWCWERNSFVNSEKDNQLINYKILMYDDYKIKLLINSKKDSNFIFAISYYPTLKAKLNETEVKINENAYGLISLYIPKGNWILEFEFIDNWKVLRHFSLFSSLFLIIYFFKRKCLRK